MLQKANGWKVLQCFFEDPLPDGQGLQLREISRCIKLAPVSVKRYLTELQAERLIQQKKHRTQGYPMYHANWDNAYFKFLKKINTILMLQESRLLDYVQDTCIPDCIILFGSGARGEDTRNSDLDLFVLCKERPIDTKLFEAKLKRNINFFFSERFTDLSPELKNNVINGIILRGYLKVF